MHQLPTSVLLADRERRKRRGRRRAVPAVALAAAFAAVALPSAAQAGTATVSNGTLTYSDNSLSGERNDVTMRPSNGRIIITDTAGASTATDFCRTIAGGLDCFATAKVNTSLGAGDDIVRYRLPQAGTVMLGSGNDDVMGGVRESAGQAIGEVQYFGENGEDVISYQEANAGVSVDMADNLANDGRPGIDRENVIGFEHLHGSNHRDTLFGTPNRDGIAGGPERDIIAGGFGDDAFYSGQRDGADDYHGGPGVDTVLYVGRTQPLTVQLDNIATDGEAGEFDNVQRNVENVFGGSGDDTIRSFGTSSRFDGGAGRDTLESATGNDTLVGGPGVDFLSSGGGIDVVDARDSTPDSVDCGTEADSLSRDITEGTVKGCESVQIGVLRLTDKTMAAKADTPARVGLNWQHPEGWRKLRTVTLRLLDEGVPVGEVVIRPSGERVTAQGVASLVRRDTRLAHKGKAVTAQLALRIDSSMAGRKLGLEVEATDTRGRRQLERDAGTIRVAK